MKRIRNFIFNWLCKKCGQNNRIDKVICEKCGNPAPHQTRAER